MGIGIKKLCLLLAIVILFTAGCYGKPKLQTETVKLYYAAKGNVALEIESRQIQYGDNQAKYINTLNELVKGPADQGRFETSISRNTKVLGVTVQDEGISVNLSKDFVGFSGILHEAAAVASVVDTLLQFEEIKKVRIMVEGSDLMALSGQPYGYMTFIDFNTAGKQEKEITLYFADSQAMFVVPEKRTILVEEGIEEAALYKLVLEELIKGPQTENLYKTIPDEVKIEYAEVEGDLVKIDFSEEMHTKHWRGAAGEAMTVASIANTLTEFGSVKRIMPTVDGEAMNIEHMVIEEPLTRMEDMVFKQE